MDTNDNILQLEKLFVEADQDIKDGLISEAFDKLVYIIEQETEYGKAYNHLGWIYETKYKNYAKAEECYRLSLKYAPDYSAVYLNYAILLSTLERFDELKKHLEGALTVRGVNKSKIWNEYGIMKELKGEYDEAIDAYKKSIQFSLINDDIDRYQKSMDRCKRKQGIMQGE
ncbi:tetratricopeptide repeat protein [Microscilla marina]|uniref:O-linked GlcNAc transferase, putative n=1 Tax=Microscilla marina ATCC 23134 TaxID=313606 RepID=A1ZID6_MICM2|nr:tetratricopeptide repeat protein [Microscilla marina]EAY29804.1 O-linked GlcNAc transferase, putative [Microscilla marina ATCC 23134]